MKIPYDLPVTVGREFVALAPDVAAAILLTLQAGWLIAANLSDVNADASEVEITERLRDGMRQALREHGFPWAKTMIVAPGTESRSRREVIRPDGRTDIPIYLIEVFVRLSEHDPHAIIECKRLAGTDTELCREYIIEGVDRFQTGKYGDNHATGFMAGYILSGEAAAAAAGVNAYLTRRSRQAEHLIPSELITAPALWTSRHPRAEPLRPIAIHHAMLELYAAGR